MFSHGCRQPSRPIRAYLNGSLCKTVKAFFILSITRFYNIRKKKDKSWKRRWKEKEVVHGLQREFFVSKHCRHGGWIQTPHVHFSRVSAVFPHFKTDNSNPKVISFKHWPQCRAANTMNRLQLEVILSEIILNVRNKAENHPHFELKTSLNMFSDSNRGMLINIKPPLICGMNIYNNHTLEIGEEMWSKWLHEMIVGLSLRNWVYQQDRQYQMLPVGVTLNQQLLPLSIPSGWGQIPVWTGFIASHRLDRTVILILTTRCL